MATHLISFPDTTLTVDMVLAEMKDLAKQSYRCIIKDMLFRYRRHLNPQGMWCKVRISWAGEGSVRIGGTIVNDAYLAKKLLRVNTAYVFLSKINDDLWNDRIRNRDSIERFLFPYIMKASINQAFAGTASVIAKMIPDYLKIYMDNPGYSDGWPLSCQKDLLAILQEDCPQIVSDLRLTEDGSFINEYTLMGIIYARSKDTRTALVLPSENKKAIRLTGDSMTENLPTPKELMEVLYLSAGLY